MVAFPSEPGKPSLPRGERRQPAALSIRGLGAWIRRRRTGQRLNQRRFPAFSADCRCPDCHPPLITLGATAAERGSWTVPRTTEKPLMFGYYSARRGIPAEQTLNHREKLTDFADREGFALADVFVEPSKEPSVALQAMFQSAQRRQVAAVVVPDLTDLGTTAQVQRVTRDRLEYAGIHVLVLLGQGR